MTPRRWIDQGGSFGVEWGGRTWTLVRDGRRLGLWVLGGASKVGPLLALDGLAVAGRTDADAFADAGLPVFESSGDPGRVTIEHHPREWPGLTVRATWAVSGVDGVDLELEAWRSPEGSGPLLGFEVRVASVLPEPSGSRPRRWVEPRDMRAAGSSYDGRESDVTDLTTLPPTADPPGRLAPRIVPSPWDDGLAYVEMTRTGEVARRITVSRKVSSLGHTTRYGVFGDDPTPGGRPRARLRGLWLLSSAPGSEALDRASAFEAEERP